MTCDFCEHEGVRKRIVTETAHAFAFPSNIPIVPGHVLVCPRRHVATIDQLSREEKEDLFQLVETIKVALKAIFQAQGFNVAWNEGEVAGQTIPHLHLHVLPRKTGDTGIVEYEPRRFLYRPDAARKDLPEEELREIVNVLREEIETMDVGKK